MRDLTKAEEQVMKVIWKLEKAFLKDVVESFPEPRPAYTTVSTVIRVLVKKKVLGYKTYGKKVNEYFPLISKDSYFSNQIGSVITNFFNGSNNQFASFFTENQGMSINELEEMKSLLDSKIQELKDKGE